MKNELTPKQERFCLEYLKDLNGAQAAIRAGYSEKTAARIACELLDKTHVSERIAQMKGAQAKRLEIDADTILRELLALATADLTQAFDDSGFMKPLSEIPENVRRSLISLEVSEIFAGMGDQRSIIGHLKKPRFHDKTRALELLGKHLKLFADRMELTGKDGKPIEHKDMSELPDEQLESKLEALLAKRKGQPE